MAIFEFPFNDTLRGPKRGSWELLGHGPRCSWGKSHIGWMAFWALRALGGWAIGAEHVAQVTHFGTLGSSEIVKQIKFAREFDRHPRVLQCRHCAQLSPPS